MGIFQGPWEILAWRDNFWFGENYLTGIGYYYMKSVMVLFWDGLKILWIPWDPWYFSHNVVWFLWTSSWESSECHGNLSPILICLWCFICLFLFTHPRKPSLQWEVFALSGNPQANVGKYQAVDELWVSVCLCVCVCRWFVNVCLCIFLLSQLLLFLVSDRHRRVPVFCTPETGTVPGVVLLGCNL